jgi:catechol 2,3-dioxygenase-like lactoylglutathione lyase family enzyme
VFDHVTIRVADRPAAARFYDTVLPVLGIAKTHTGEHFDEWGDFSVAAADPEHPVTRALHIGFAAPSRDHIHAFWEAGTAAGYRDDGEPGPRPVYGDDYYGSFLLDPDGNSAEAALHDSVRQGGGIDHLWLRVADLPAGRRFYETIGPYAGFEPSHDSPQRAGFSGGNGSFSLVAGEPVTENVHLAFAAGDNGTVDTFHRAAVDAGYRDNGPPGERAEYHPGYYGAFVLDPAGHNVEVVSHNR